MRLRILLLFTLLYCKSTLFSQTLVSNPSKSDFYEALTILASDSLQGRKPNEKGGRLAASYISAKMKSYKLKAYNDFQHYFQTFEIQEHTVKKTSLQITKTNHKTISLSPEKDFEVTPTANSIQKKQLEVVFASYGLDLSKENHEDYKTLDVKIKLSWF